MMIIINSYYRHGNRTLGGSNWRTETVQFLYH